MDDIEEVVFFWVEDEFGFEAWVDGDDTVDDLYFEVEEGLFDLVLVIEVDEEDVYEFAVELFVHAVVFFLLDGEG